MYLQNVYLQLMHLKDIFLLPMKNPILIDEHRISFQISCKSLHITSPSYYFERCKTIPEDVEFRNDIAQAVENNYK